MEILKGCAVIDDGVDVGDVSNQAIREAVATVVEGTGGEANLGKVDGGELEEPTGLAGVAVYDNEGSDDSFMLM